MITLTIPLALGATPIKAILRAPISYETVQSNLKIVSAKQINPTTVEVLFADNHRMTIDFYGENIFRLFQDNSGGILRAPEAKPEAEILVKNPCRQQRRLLRLERI